MRNRSLFDELFDATKAYDWERALNLVLSREFSSSEFTEQKPCCAQTKLQMLFFALDDAPYTRKEKDRFYAPLFVLIAANHAIDFNQADNYGCTLAHIVAERGYCETMTQLLQHGISTHRIWHFKNNLYTVLGLADDAQNNHEMVELLWRHQNAQSTTHHHNTPRLFSESVDPLAREAAETLLQSLEYLCPPTP